jgi:flagellar motor switch/type III secretory pathway protein FliN
VEHHQRYAQKKQSLQTINLMWANTQQPYYQQQQQAMSGQLQQLEQQLDESLGLYNTALQGLCSVVNGDVLLLDTIQGSSLQNIIKQHVSECQANQVLALSREQMIQGLQMLQASN